MKKVICMVMATVMSLSIVGCHKAEVPASSKEQEGLIACTLSDTVRGMQPFEHYERRDLAMRYVTDGIFCYTEGITFKGLGHH